MLPSRDRQGAVSRISKQYDLSTQMLFELRYLDEDRMPTNEESPKDESAKDQATVAAESKTDEIETDDAEVIAGGGGHFGTTTGGD